LETLDRRLSRSSGGTSLAPKGTTALTREYSRRFGGQGSSFLKFILNILTNVATVSFI
jgi:hypothetical protein